MPNDLYMDAHLFKEERTIHSLEDALDVVGEEYVVAREKFPKMNSAHEGYAILKEEVDELWDEVKAKHPDRQKMRDEAVQVAAMAIAFVLELT